MSEVGLTQLLHHPALEALLSGLPETGELCLPPLPACAQAYLAAGWRLRHPEQALVLLAPEVKRQEEIANDLEAWRTPALFFPESGALEPESVPDPDTQAETLDLLQLLMENSHCLVTATASGWTRKLPAPESLQAGLSELRVGQTLDPEILQQRLEQAGYQREGRAVQRGQYARRGGIFDVYSWNGTSPLRIEWFGDEIESIREFDPGTQESTKVVPRALLALVVADTANCPAGLADYFPARPLLWKTDDAEGVLPATFIEHSFLHQAAMDPVLQENRRRLLLGHLQDWIDDAWSVWISCNNEGEEQRLKEWLAEQKLQPDHCHFCQSPLLRGFSWPEARVVVLTDAEIFGRYQTLRALRRNARLQAQRARQTALDFSDLQDGDYVVHAEHGIACTT